MGQNERFVIIGGGIAGVTAAETLRTEGFNGQIVLVDGDKNLPYDRPPLSKNFLKGKSHEEDVLFRELSFYSNNNIQLELGESVKNIDPTKREISLENGKSLGWDKLLLATGSKARRLKIPGSNLPGVYYLKDLDSAYHLRDALAKIKKLVIIGGGFIGLEVAAVCRSLGIDVTVLEVMPVPLARAVGEDVGRFLVDVHHSNGVRIMTDTIVKEIRDSSQGMEVITENDDSFSCDAVLECIGTVSENQMLKNTGLEPRITVDDFGETEIPDIFAAGDCAYWNYFIEKTDIRVEHWDHAVNHGKVAAKNMLKPGSEKYRVIPYFWSDQYDGKLQYVGHPLNWDYTVMRGRMSDNKFTIFMIRNERVVGALAWNDIGSVMPSRRLIEREILVNSEDLANPNIKLKKLIKQKA